MKNIIVFVLAVVLIGVLVYAGINGISRGHSTGPFFIFLALCASTGLAIDAQKLWKERTRQANARKFGRQVRDANGIFFFRVRGNALNENNLTEWVGIVAGVFTSTSLLPQLIKMFRNKKAEDISIFFLIALFIGVSLWIVYGFLRQDIPVIATNCFSFIVNATMLILGIRYKRREAKKT